jgi:hypothetical protein
VVDVLSEGIYKNFHVPDSVSAALGDDFDGRIETAIQSKASALATTDAR